MSPNTRDYVLTFCYAFAAIVTTLLGLTFWRLGDHSLWTAGRWLFVWLWTVVSPAFYASQIRRRMRTIATAVTPDAFDALQRLAWQILMAGSLAALGVVSLVREYVHS